MKKILLLSIFFVLAFAIAAYALLGRPGNPTVIAAAGAECTTDNDGVVFAFGTTSTAARGSDDEAYYGQSFQLGATTDVTGVNFYTRGEDNSGGATYQLHLYAYDTVGDEPTGAELASTTADDIDNLPSTVADYFFEFSSYPELSAGWYIIYGTSNTDGKFIWLNRDTASVANGDYIYTADGGDNWTESGSYDFRGIGVYGCQ